MSEEKESPLLILSPSRRKMLSSPVFLPERTQEYSALDVLLEDPELPQLDDWYLEVGALLGQGGQGAVHCGTYDGRPVAIKMVLGLTRESASLFARELKVAHEKMGKASL